MSFFKSTSKRTPEITTRTHSLLPTPHDTDDEPDVDSTDTTLFRNTEINSRTEQYTELPTRPKRNLDRSVSFLETVEVIGYVESDVDENSLPAAAINVRVSSYFYDQFISSPFQETSLTPTMSPMATPDLTAFTASLDTSSTSLMDELMNDDLYADYFNESPHHSLLESTPANELFIDTALFSSLQDSDSTDAVSQDVLELKLHELVEPAYIHTMTLPTPPLRHPSPILVKVMVSTATQDDREPVIEEPKPKKKIRHVQIQVRIPAQEIYTQTDQEPDIPSQATLQLIAAIQTECEVLRHDRYNAEEAVSDLQNSVEVLRTAAAEMERDRVVKEGLMEKAYEQMKRLLLEKEASQRLVEYLYTVIAKDAQE